MHQAINSTQWKRIGNAAFDENHLSVGKIKYEFIAKVWQHASPGGWYIVSVPQVYAKEIRDHLKSEEEGWGRLTAIAKTGTSEWKTAIWFDTKMDTYLLPLKSEIRKREQIEDAMEIKVMLSI